MTVLIADKRVEPRGRRLVAWNSLLTASSSPLVLQSHDAVQLAAHEDSYVLHLFDLRAEDENAPILKRH
jgi:hypothetical protein